MFTLGHIAPGLPGVAVGWPCVPGGTADPMAPPASPGRFGVDWRDDGAVGVGRPGFGRGLHPRPGPGTLFGSLGPSMGLRQPPRMSLKRALLCHEFAS